MPSWTVTIRTEQGSTEVDVPAGTARVAAGVALHRNLHLRPVIGLDVRPAGSSPVIPDLVSNSDVAQILGVSRQRAKQLDDHPPAGYPAAVAHCGAGALRLRAEVEAWAATPRKSGRPKAS